MTSDDRFRRAVLTGALVLVAIHIGLSLVLTKGWMVLYFSEHNHPAADLFFRYVTHFGDGLWFVALPLLLLFRDFFSAAYAAVCGIFHGICVNLLKRQLFPHLDRPLGYFEDPDLLHSIEGVDIHSHFTFPSGHTTSAFTAAFLLSVTFRNPWLSFIFYLIAFCVAWSRVYLMQHFLVDVTGGMLLGLFCGALAWLAMRRLRYRDPWMKRLRMPGR